jgi:hypothetical protein
MSRSRLLYLAAGALILSTLTVRPAQAVVIGYVGNPTGNSSDFSNAVGALGGSISVLDFEAHPLGLLMPGFYTGVTLVGTSGFDNVTSGSGPGQANTFSPPLSTGEGPHPVSHYVGDGGAGTFTISFDAPVLGVGLFVIDLWNPDTSNRNGVTIEAFTGSGGTGASLGLFDAAVFNFQQNNLYFMGITSSASDIGSLVFTSPGNGGDIVGLDDMFVASSGVAPVPEPGTLLLFGGGLIGLARARRRHP